MIAFAVYLLKVSVGLAAFYALYIILFKDYTFIRFNRYYLISGLMISFLIPFVNISLPVSSPNFPMTGFFEPSANGLTADMILPKSAEHGAKISVYAPVLVALYFAGVVITLLRVAVSVRSILRLKGNSETYSHGHLTIIKSKMQQSFSFFNMIFLPEHEVNPFILKHEKVHVEQYHWIDLILVEMACAILWFNPLMIFYRRAIKLQHEYLADAIAVGKDAHVEQYLDCLLNQVAYKNSLRPISPFHSTELKKRIMMITKSKTSGKFSITYLLFLPVLGMLLLGFSNRQASVSVPAVRLTHSVDENIPSILPVIGESITIASDFGYRIHPYYNKRRFHTGVDFTSKEGIPVVSTASGVVTESKSDSLWGNYVIVKHSDLYATSYSHLKSATVEVGDILAKGQTIGYVGSTGQSTAPHLHYEVHKNGKPVNPKDYLPKAK